MLHKILYVRRAGICAGAGGEGVRAVEEETSDLEATGPSCLPSPHPAYTALLPSTHFASSIWSTSFPHGTVLPSTLDFSGSDTLSPASLGGL